MKTIFNYSNFILKSYNYLNSLVPYKSIQIVFNNSYMKEIAETLPFGTIKINNYNASKYIQHYEEYGENRIKTVLMEIIAHEISHVNQNINYYIISRYSEHNPGYDDYIKFIETTNIKNSIELLLSVSRDINQLFGFILDTNWLIDKMNYNSNHAKFVSKHGYEKNCFEQSLGLLFNNDQFKNYPNILLLDKNNSVYPIKYNGKYTSESSILFRLDTMIDNFDKFEIVEDNAMSLLVK